MGLEDSPVRPNPDLTNDFKVRNGQLLYSQRFDTFRDRIILQIFLFAA